MRDSLKKVVDSNFLQCEALRAYLSKSFRHYVVMTDYAFMEAYKAHALEMLYRSMAILAQYPQQVIVLKGTQIVRGLNGRPARLQQRLIDVKGTRGFSEFCGRLTNCCERRKPRVRSATFLPRAR